MSATVEVPVVQSAPKHRILNLLDWLNTRVVGQQHLTRRLVMALLCDGHLIVEGAPGLAKTRAIKELGKGIEGDFHRVQFTPDLLPSDITGTEIYRPETGAFEFQKGPIFHNLLLADEVNRAPAKVQSALLEGMAERQVTIGRQTYSLPSLFLVMATQNPIEQEGTYALPEAQLDRFLLHVEVGYPDSTLENQILQIARTEALGEDEPAPLQLGLDEIFQARAEIANLHMADPVERYIVDLVTHTRTKVEELEFGASPRASIALDLTSRTEAWLNNRDYVTPDDVQKSAHDVFRHRLILTMEAEARGTDINRLIDRIINQVTVY